MLESMHLATVSSIPSKPTSLRGNYHFTQIGKVGTLTSLDNKLTSTSQECQENHQMAWELWHHSKHLGGKPATPIVHCKSCSWHQGGSPVQPHLNRYEPKSGVSKRNRPVLRLTLWTSCSILAATLNLVRYFPYIFRSPTETRTSLQFTNPFNDALHCSQAANPVLGGGTPPVLQLHVDLHLHLDLARLGAPPTPLAG